jgi:hypothetical protein
MPDVHFEDAADRTVGQPRLIDIGTLHRPVGPFMRTMLKTNSVLSEAMTVFTLGGLLVLSPAARQAAGQGLESLGKALTTLPTQAPAPARHLHHIAHRLHGRKHGLTRAS